jgi:DNA-binding transcriptional LysR family regulator
LRNITLKQFRYFIAVAETSSVAAAARMVNIAQSAITKSILELEDEVDAKLFERLPKGMQLTPDGHRFLLSARKVLASVSDASSLLKSTPKGLSGRLTIGVSSLVAGYYLSEFVSRFRRSCPDVKIHLVEETPQFLEHLLINGEVDVAIMLTNMLAEPQALAAETLTRSPIRVWMASNHPLTRLDEVTLEDCSAFDFVMLDADRIDDLLRSMWARRELTPKVLMRTSSLEGVRSLVGLGAGIAILPDFLYRPWTLDAEHVDVRNLREAVATVDIGLVWRRGTSIKATALEFIEQAREQTRPRRGSGGSAYN